VTALRKWRLLIGGVAIVLFLIWCGQLAYRMATTAKTYTYRVKFRTMPHHDQPLADWLRAQPGVARADVAREGNTIIAVFVMSANEKDSEPALVSAAVKRLGYGGWEGMDSRCNFVPVSLLPW
jgi:hypothetical protein